MKLLTGLNILVCIILVLGVAVTANNITLGHVSPGDVFLNHTSVVLPSRWFGAHKIDVSFPPRGFPYPVFLSSIIVKDRGGKKNFGYAELTKGGPGQGYATIRLRSQNRKPLNFTIQFYGRRRKY